jgi:hypothetical protein
MVQNHVWAYDFVFDRCANGQTLKCLTVVDEWTRECLAIDVAGGIRSSRVIEVLTQLVSVHGAPRFLRSDNGPEFVAAAILRWLDDAGIDTALIDPGKPWQNATDESFNGKFRDEYLSLQWFHNRIDARVGIEQWRRHYNQVRPHSSLGYLTPVEFKATQTADRVNGGPRTNTKDLHRAAPFSSNQWSEESRQVRRPWTTSTFPAFMRRSRTNHVAGAWPPATRVTGFQLGMLGNAT